MSFENIPEPIIITKEYYDQLPEHEKWKFEKLNKDKIE